MWANLQKKLLNFLPKTLSLSSQKYRFGIRYQGSGKNLSRIQGSKRHRIPDPDLQHWPVLFYFSGSEAPLSPPEAREVRPAAEPSEAAMAAMKSGENAATEDPEAAVKATAARNAAAVKKVAASDLRYVKTYIASVPRHAPRYCTVEECFGPGSSKWILQD
jgi:hypothetical protein